MRKRAIVALAAALVLSAPGARGQLAPEARSRALKIIAQLEKLERETLGSARGGARSCEFTEAEVNDWVAYRVSTEMDKYVKSLDLRLLPGNRAEGKLVIDLSATPASAVLPSRVDLFFSAGAETADGKIRITMDRLYLGTQRLSPAFIDTVIGLVAGLEGKPATSLKDWYPLPYGIQRLESRAGRLICHY